MDSAEAVFQGESSEGWGVTGEECKKLHSPFLRLLPQRLWMEGIAVLLGTSALLPRQSFPQIRFSGQLEILFLSAVAQCSFSKLSILSVC